MKKITILRSLAILLMAANIQISAASDFGFCTDNVARSNIFRVGSTEKQGLAIRLSSEKLAALKGCTISGINAAFGSRRTTGGTVDLFISTDPNGTPLVSQTSAVTEATKWLSFQLETPYTITGDELCLYVGYTGAISSSSTMLMGDYSADTKGCSFAYKDGEWVDIYGMGYGSASIRVTIDNAPTVNDLIMKPLPVEGYFVAGKDYTMSGQLFNFGNTNVTSFDLKVKVEGSDEVVSHISGISVEPGDVYDFMLPNWSSASAGDVSLNMQVSNINGTADSDPSDNDFNKSVFFYPAVMERTVLLEGFTGQDCSNCPNGHSEIAKFLASATTTPVIEVMHHSGYQPDYFSMDVDYDYTYFYGSPSTYAPAVMLNRAATFKEVPVMNTGEDYLTYVYGVLEEKFQPYVSLQLNSAFNADSRELKIDFSSFAHTDLPAGDAALNVMLVQDGLVSKQVPLGEGYTHDAVCRGVVTGNSWGILLNADAVKKGGEAKWTTTITLPESIYSDMEYTQKDPSKCNWPAIPEKMRLVAYVAAHGDGPAKRQIYNAIEVPLGGSHTQAAHPSAAAIKTVVSSDAPSIRVEDGCVSVDGDYDSMKVYALDGRTMKTDTRLPSGVYVVSVSKGNSAKTVKIRVK